MASKQHVAIFWDYENCRPPANTSGYTVVNGILKAIQGIGPIMLFKAYVDLTLDALNSKTILHSELQSSGVSLTHCPHNGKKDVSDKMMIADMLAFAIDNRAPATIVLITGDRDFAYAISLLKLRGYNTLVVVPFAAHASLKMQANKVLQWQGEVLGCMELQSEKSQALDGPPSKITQIEPTSYLNWEASRSPSETMIDSVTSESSKATCCIPQTPVSPLPTHRRTLSEAGRKWPNSPTSSSRNSSTTIEMTCPFIQDGGTGHFPGRLALSKYPIASAPLSNVPTTTIQVNGTNLQEVSDIFSETFYSLDSESFRDEISSENSRDMQHFEESVARTVEYLKDLDKIGPTTNSAGPASTGCLSDQDVCTREDSSEMRHSTPLHASTDAAQHEPTRSTKNPDDSKIHGVSATLALDASSSSISGATLQNSDVREGPTVPSVGSVTANPAVGPSSQTPSNRQQKSSSDAGRFSLLVDLLKGREGSKKVKGSLIGSELLKKDGKAYEKVGTYRLRDYIELAVEAGVVTATAADKFGDCWIELVADATPLTKPQSQAAGVPEAYKPLLTILQFSPSIPDRMFFRECGSLIRDMHPGLYQKAGVHRLTDYITRAEELGLVRIGGTKHNKWVEAVRKH